MSIVSYKSALAPAMAIIFERTFFRLRLQEQFFEEQQQLSFETQCRKKWHRKIGPFRFVSYKMPTCKS